MKKTQLLIIGSLLFISVAIFSCVTTAGVLANTGKYAWSSAIGWINFDPDQGGVTVSNSAVTGYAWSESFGWINLSPSQQGVVNNGSGTLSGYAWGENTGWINFSGVTINCSGIFSGTATGDVVGTINFSCSNCNVSTTWRAASCSGGAGGSTGGGSIGAISPPSVTPPTTVPPQTQPPSVQPPNQPPTITPPSTVVPGSPPSNQPPGTPGTAGPSGPAGPGLPPTAPVVTPAPPENTVQNSIKAVIGQARKFIETPAASVATKIVSTAGVVGGVAIAASTVIFSPSSLFEIFLIPARLLAIVLAGLGLRKKRVSWGVVYDSQTKQPLDPAYVLLQDLNGRDIASAITDLDGRFGFLAPAGIYKMVANKTNYLFPSKKLAGKTNDELYGNLYFGEPIEVKTMGDAIIKNIPLDPVKFDWNEFAKKNKNLMKFYSKWDRLFIRFSNGFFAIGFVVAVVAFFAAPYPYNSIIMALYLVLLLLRVLGLKPRPYGFISEQATGNPLSFAIMRVLAADSRREVTYKVSDQYGRYYCLLPTGNYYVTIEKKQPDGSYQLVHTSPVIAVSKRGILKQKFMV